MLRRLFRIAALAFAASLAASSAPAQPAQQPRIVAVGDLHGDHSAWRDIARAAGLIGSKGQWTGGKATLVQVGDIVDRGDDSLKILRDLMRLQKEAPRQGGKVIVLVGNHEAMNVIGDLRYVTPGEFAAFAGPKSAAVRDSLYEAKKKDIEAKYRASDPSLSSARIRDLWLKETPLGWAEHRLAWAVDGEIGRWVIRNPAAALVNGNLFVHGGISAEYAQLPLAELNARVAAALSSADQKPDSIISGPLGPLWYRGLITRDPKVTQIPPAPAGSPPRPSVEQELEAVLKAHGAKRIIVGHSPRLAGIEILFGGRLVRIDSGISGYYRGVPSYLEIIGDKLVPHQVRRSQGAAGGSQ